MYACTRAPTRYYEPCYHRIAIFYWNLPHACLPCTRLPLSPPHCVAASPSLPHSGDYLLRYLTEVRSTRRATDFHLYQICRRYPDARARACTRHSRLHHEPFQSAHGFVQRRRSGIPNEFSARLIIRAASISDAQCVRRVLCARLAISFSLFFCPFASSMLRSKLRSKFCDDTAPLRIITRI